MPKLTGLNTPALKKGECREQYRNYYVSHRVSGDPEPSLAKGRARLYSNRFCPFAERALLYVAAKGLE